MMQEFPVFYVDFTKSPDELIKLYKILKRTMYWMNQVGFKGVTTVAGAGAAYKASQAARAGYLTNGLRGAARAVTANAGSIATLENTIAGDAGRAIIRRVGVAGGFVGGAIIVTAALGYQAMLERTEQIENLIEILYRQGNATEKQYLAIIQNVELDRIELDKYWE